MGIQLVCYLFRLGFILIFRFTYNTFQPQYDIRRNGPSVKDNSEYRRDILKNDVV